ncbi:MAG: GMC family oxidoreductase N-terminal domain-containing protein [Gemmatimonadetes bacterium]|nr:GMC family oxidoreductase N-terminal domain-containing protein [Gemmatimonadota bacterium]
MDPWYEMAEGMLRVEQIDAALVPKSGLVFSLLMKNLGYSCERARYAVQGCLGSGFCVTGCVYGAKQSLLLNYLPQAVAAGAVIETDLEARAVAPIGEPGNVPGGGAIADLPFRYLVTCRRRTGSRDLVGYRARILVLAAGTVGTASLLLNSRALLPRLSDQIGRNIAFNGSVKAAGILPDGFADGDMFAGRSHPGMISYEFLARAASRSPPRSRCRCRRSRRPGCGWTAMHASRGTGALPMSS